MRVRTGQGTRKRCVSIGFATSDPGMSGHEDLIQQADRGVHRAREAGKDRARALDGAVEQGAAPGSGLVTRTP